VPGDGDPIKMDWSHVYKKISDSGKKIQAHFGFESYYDEILRVIERPDLLIKSQFYAPIAQKETMLKRLQKEGAL
jgi:hypothetical protein